MTPMKHVLKILLALLVSSVALIEVVSSFKWLQVERSLVFLHEFGRTPLSMVE
jgi:hypothetical protein